MTRDLQLDLIDDPAALSDLAPEWDALWRRIDGTFAESPTACRLAWEHVSGPAGDRFVLLTGRRSGELVLLLPTVVRRRGPVRILQPLGPGAADSTVLLAPTADRRGDGPAAPDDVSSAELAQAWGRLARHGGADVAQMPGVATDSQLRAVLDRAGAQVVHTDVSPMATHRPGETFEEYAAALGKLNHNRPGVLRTRLARLGELSIDLLEPDDPQTVSLLDWLLGHKQRWAGAAGKVGPWLTDPGYRNHLLAVLALTGPPVARLLVVRLDGRPVAAAVLGLGRTTVEGLINAYDPEFARSSPGLVMVEACVEFAFGTGRSIELGPGPEAYKGYWSAGRMREVVTVEAPLSLRGRLALGARDLARRRQAGATP